ncbi:Putative RNA polymerase II subunit A [Septoria linicola]|uniref:protein-serine/threonine phosphatase n=1 Tax=Septoria linicola TaxID=215465 RepID=A0A9Q9EFT7_9PEZI|nr:putative RNA polymerase II subunit A [Septoria linicola]USW49305.1 Putative RNA polymerase II subunit A [Septoria linicola]
MSTDPRRRPPPPPPPPADPTQQSQPVDETAVRQQKIAENITMATSQPPTQSQQQQQNGHHDPQTLLNNASPSADSFKLRFCTVCASNNNRSMEAHLRLTTAPDPYPTISFGTGSLVRLPGPSISQPNVYHFNQTSYEKMYDELKEKDKRLYSANGILNMLERNKGVKWGPERWQDWKIGVPRIGARPTDGAEGGAEADWSMDKGHEGTEAGTVDVVVTCEERCWDAVVDDLLTRGSPLNRPVHVFNVDIKDNHEEALVGGRAILELADRLNEAAREERKIHVATGGIGSTFDQGGGRAGFDERVPDILAEWQEKWPQLPALWTLAWF